MAEKDNYWDPARRVWVDGATQNVMKPVDQGGDGIWYSSDGKYKYVNNQWISAQQAAAGNGSATELTPNPGYQYDVAALNSSTQLENTDRNNAAAMERQRADQDWQREQTRIDSEFQAKQAELNRQFTAQQNAQDQALQRELQAGRIDADKYMQAKALAQQEAEFTRTMALQTLQADRDFQLRSAEEARQERLLRANLAASPVDTVAYEFYKRGGEGTPQAWSGAQQQAQGQQQQQTQNPGDGEGSGQFTPNPLSGQPYQADNPAYSDETLQDLVSGFYNAGGQGNPYGTQTLWNPRLSGTGAFGVQIQGPQAISRAEGSRMTDDEMGVLSSFLKAGIDMGGGRRVSIDPNEYFRQAEESWIPTYNAAAQAGGRTEYR